jgi:hypothetical protein
MKKQTVEELRQEEALILIWIRDVTAPKRARLREIRCKLNGVLHLEIKKEKNGVLAKPPYTQVIR